MGAIGTLNALSRYSIQVPHVIPERVMMLDQTAPGQEETSCGYALSAEPGAEKERAHCYGPRLPPRGLQLEGASRCAPHLSNRGD